MSRMIPIGEVLKEYGYITDEQLGQALAVQKKDGKFQKKTNYRTMLNSDKSDT